MIAPAPLMNGLHRGLPMEEYRAIDAVGSGRLEWLAISPKHFRYLSDSPEQAETEAQLVGSALHMLTLEPDAFAARYVLEPDPAEVAPGNVKPRATAAYRAAVAALEERGLTVLRSEVMAQIEAMADAIHSHPHASALLKRCPEREVTAIWDEDGIRCRARFDMLGPGVIGDLKTTRKLKDFSPWALTKLGYYRQAAWYRSGAAACGVPVDRFFFIAVENAAPYDVGVFALEDDVLDVGAVECLRLLAVLQGCKKSGEWPGMYPDVQVARLTDAVALQMPELEEVE